MFGSHPSRWIILLVFGALSALGCVGTTDTGPQGETGSLSVDLVLADGVEIDEVAWQITGNGMDMSGDIDVSAPGSTASVEVFGLPPGDEDYTVMLTATSTDEGVTCQGSAPFNVEIGKATDVMVMLNCKKPRTLGGVRVNGEFNICTQLTKVVVSPLQTSVGNDITLMSQAFDAEGDTIKYVWSGDGGSIADPSAANTTYTCQEVGEHMVTVMATDNDVYCKMATWTVPVTCVEGDGGDLCEGVTCDDTGNECTAAECNPANGECETSNVEDGTDCGDGGMCSSGECVAADLCLDVQCDECNACDPATGLCAPADEGADCGDGGMCTGGECIVVDLCEGVTCDDTGNECTVAMCNTQTGECDTMDVPDGTECDGGNGACSSGVCVDNNLCAGVDCTSSNECVQDGICDPATGMCVDGANQPADTACGDGGVCDGQGTCVACNDASQCTDDGNACTAASCVDNVCGQANEPDGTMCDLLSVGDGVCMAGVCEAAPECVSPGDCDDGNECTAGDCVGGTCEFTPTDGASCLVEVGVPGTCDNAGACIGLCDGVVCTSSNQCVQDGSCDVQSGECIPGANEPEGTTCDQDGGTACDGAGNCVSAATACNDGLVQSGVVTVGCTNGVTANQSEFPNVLDVTVAEPVIAGAAFTADFSGVGVFPQFFLDAAQSTVPGGVRSAIIEGFEMTATIFSGATGADVSMGPDAAGIVPGLTSFCQYPGSRVCTADSDCIVPPCNVPVLLIEVPISEECGAGGVCEGLGQGTADGPTAQCNITDPPSFCVTGDMFIPSESASGVFTADVGPSEVVFGWGADPATSTCPSADSRCASNGGTIPDRSLALPPSIYGDPVGGDPSGPNGIRLNVGNALFVAVQCEAGQAGGTCVAGTDAGLGCATDAECPGSTCDLVGPADVIVDSDPATLPRCPIN